MQSPPTAALPDLPVETIGDGPDLVLLHGWGLHSEFFRPWLPHVLPHCRVHLIDLPGHGLSPAVTPFTLDAMAHAVAHSMARVAPRYAVAGWSLGGAVALRMAIDFPDRISHVVTLASAPRFLRADDWTHATTPHALELLRGGLGRDYAGTLAQFFELNLASRWSALSATLKHLTTQRPATQRIALEDGMALTSSVDLRDEIARIRAPLLAVSGRLDRLSYSQSSAWLAARTGGTHIELAHAAHAPHLSHGEETAAAVLAHLGIDSIPGGRDLASATP